MSTDPLTVLSSPIFALFSTSISPFTVFARSAVTPRLTYAAIDGAQRSIVSPASVRDLTIDRRKIAAVACQETGLPAKATNRRKA